MDSLNQVVIESRSTSLECGARTRIRQFQSSRGASLIEMLVQLFIIVAIAPVIVCCVVQALSMMVATAVPWVAIVAIVIGLAACVAAFMAAAVRNHPHLPPPGGALGGDGEPILPIRRPPPLPGPGAGPGREHRE